MRKILFSVLGCLVAVCAHAAQIVNVDYVHKLIAQKWDVSVPIKADSPMQVANMKYLLTAVDVANEILNGEKTTDYGNTEFATLQVADTVATIQAVDTLVRKEIEYKFFLTTTSTNSFSFSISAAGEFVIDWGDGTVETKTKALEAAAKQLATMLAEVDEAKINKALFASVERAIVISKAALEGAVKAEAEAKAALELDPSVTDWEAKVEAYKAEIAKLDSEWYKKDAEIDEQMASMRDSAKAEGAIGKMVADYEAFTGYEFDEKTGYFSKLNTPTFLLLACSFIYLQTFFASPLRIITSAFGA